MELLRLEKIFKIKSSHKLLLSQGKGSVFSQLSSVTK